MSSTDAPAPGDALVPDGVPGRRLLRGGGLRSRIAAMLVVVCGAVVVLAAAAGYVLHVADWHAQRLRFAHGQLEATAELAASANRYSEQIAEILLLGEGELPDFLEARADVEAAFIRLSRLISDQIVFLDSREDEREREMAERLRLARGRSLYLEIDRAVERMLVLRAAGRRDEAVLLFRDEIEDRLDAELDSLLAEAMKGERQEVIEADAEAAQQIRNATATVVLAAAAALAATLLVGRSLRRTLVTPVLALAEGAQALGRGELSRRVPEDRRSGELGLLAARFNAMAAQLEEQHGRLARARDEAEAEVRARTTELREANDSLRQVDRGRVRFLGDLSHELRTPLTVLRGEAEVALRGGARPVAQREALEVVVRQAVQMERLVADLLFLARSEAAEARLVTRPVCLQDVLAEAVEEGATLARGGAIKLLGDDWPEAPIAVEADPQRLRQALLIAVDNAVKYSPSDGAVSVGLRLADGGRRAEILVANSGPGLGPDEAAQAFDRFFRGRNARAMRDDGSGLGLAIAKSIVERHNGTIALDSARDGPTVLRIALPLAAVHGVEHAEDTSGRGRPADRGLRAAKA